MKKTITNKEQETIKTTNQPNIQTVTIKKITIEKEA